MHDPDQNDSEGVENQNNVIPSDSGMAEASVQQFHHAPSGATEDTEYSSTPTLVSSGYCTAGYVVTLGNSGPEILGEDNANANVTFVPIREWLGVDNRLQIRPETPPSRPSDEMSPHLSSPGLENDYREIEEGKLDVVGVRKWRKTKTAAILEAGVGCIICGLALYSFMVGIKVMESAFAILMGCDAGSLFSFTSNSIAGLMVGILVTVLVQSSSTSVAVLVSVVGAGGISVNEAVPILMGANIGTAITSTIVSLAQITEKNHFERAFAAATLHDSFNLLSVLVFLPLQLLTGFISRLSAWIVGNGLATTGKGIQSPFNAITAPVAELLVSVDKDIIKDAATGNVRCQDVTTIIDDGVVYGKMSDTAAGIVLLVSSLAVMILALFSLLRVLKYFVKKCPESTLTKIFTWNGYATLLIGIGVTLIVQSSSVVTSMVTPLAGVELVTVTQAFPLIVGANIGTTGTAFMAALVSADDNALQLALCHFFFNLFGALLWYPLPPLRELPLDIARLNGWIGARWAGYAFLYVITIFILLPCVLLVLTIFFGKTGTLWFWVAAAAALSFLVGLITLVWWLVISGGKAHIARWLESRNRNEQGIRCSLQTSHPPLPVVLKRVTAPSAT